MKNVTKLGGTPPSISAPPGDSCLHCCFPSGFCLLAAGGTPHQQGLISSALGEPGPAPFGQEASNAWSLFQDVNRPGSRHTHGKVVFTNVQSILHKDDMKSHSTYPVQASPQQKRGSSQPRGGPGGGPGRGSPSGKLFSYWKGRTRTQVPPAIPCLRAPLTEMGPRVRQGLRPSRQCHSKVARSGKHPGGPQNALVRAYCQVTE